RRRSPRAPSTRRTCSAARTASAGWHPAIPLTSSSSTAPTGATSPITWAAITSPRSSRAGCQRDNRPMPSRKQRRRREKLQRHEYEYVIETEEGEVIQVEKPVER